MYRKVKALSPIQVANVDQIIVQVFNPQVVTMGTKTKFGCTLLDISEPFPNDENSMYDEIQLSCWIYKDKVNEATQYFMNTFAHGEVLILTNLESQISKKSNYEFLPHEFKIDFRYKDKDVTVSTLFDNGKKLDEVNYVSEEDYVSRFPFNYTELSTVYSDMQRGCITGRKGISIFGKIRVVGSLGQARTCKYRKFSIADYQGYVLNCMTYREVAENIEFAEGDYVLLRNITLDKAKENKYG